MLSQMTSGIWVREPPPLPPSDTAPPPLRYLQIRPQSEITASASARALRFNYLPSELNAVVASTRALGHGSFEGIRDVVYVSPER
jgi:hypothetical protein